MAIYIRLMFCLGIILSRILPHPPNMTPFIAFSVLLASLSRFAMIEVLMSLAISDLLLALIFHYPLWGTWSIFTYSGMIGMIFTVQYFRKFCLFSGLSAATGFWVWTNFGVWLTSHLYPMTSQGLLNCYIAAIPFLGYSLAGTGLGFALYRFIYPKSIPQSSS